MSRILRHTGVGGFWAYDRISGRAYGDAITRSYLVWPGTETSDSVPISAVLERIAPEDRDRVGRALDHAVETSGTYRETLTIQTQRGWRTIFAVACCEPTIYGDCSALTGWFVDITGGKVPKQFALNAAAHYIKLAKIAACSGGSPTADYLLEDALLEIDQAKTGD